MCKYFINNLLVSIVLLIAIYNIYNYFVFTLLDYDILFE